MISWTPKETRTHCARSFKQKPLLLLQEFYWKLIHPKFRVNWLQSIILMLVWSMWHNQDRWWNSSH